MSRKLIFVLCVVALTVFSASCGRQVTPSRTAPGSTLPPPAGLSPGFMQIKFSTAGAALDFTNVWYVIAFNTSGTGGEPYAINGNTSQNWQDFSFEIVVGASGGPVQATLWQFISVPQTGGGSVKAPYGPIFVTPQQLQLNTNCNGNQTEFCVTLDRSIFYGIGAPTSTSSPSAGPTGESEVSTWYINWFTASPTGNPVGQVIDAPGTNGATNTNWLPSNGSFDVTTTFDDPWYAVGSPAWPQVTPQSAQIGGGEVVNNP